MQINKQGNIEMAIGFSQNFGFSINIISTALRAFSERERISRKELMRFLGVGDNKAESTVTWLGYLGLRNNNNGKVTALGNLLLRFDPHFQDIITTWIFHYMLASNPKAEVWYLLSNEFIPLQTWFSFDDAINFLVLKGLRSKDDKHLKADASIFLRSFISEDALRKAVFLKTESEPKRKISQNNFYKNPSSNISPYLVAYVIFDQKEKKYPNFSTITVKELLNLNGNVGRVFSLNRKKLEETIKLLSSRQYNRLLSFSTTGGLDQVGLLFKGKSLEILKMYFKTEKE